MIFVLCETKQTIYEVGGGFWVNPLKKENTWQKSFPDNAEWKLWKIISADVKAHCKTEGNKITGGCILPTSA